MVRRQNFFSMDENFGYVPNASKQETEVYNLKTGLLEQVLTYEQYAEKLGYNLDREGTGYVLHFTDMTNDTPKNRYPAHKRGFYD